MEDVFLRGQFTFYRSFYEAMQDIEDPNRRADTYDMVCAYALNNDMPDFADLLPIQRNTLRLIFPVLDAARKKAEGGMKHGKEYQKKEDSRKIAGRYKKDPGNKGEIEKEKEIENEIEIECERKGTDLGLCRDRTDTFDIFWNIYPKKVCKDAARAAYEKAAAPLEVLLNAVEEQKKSKQWNQDGGKYIPNPAAWLEHRRWEDELPAVQSGEVRASGRLGETERAAIRKMMSSG